MKRLLQFGWLLILLGWCVPSRAQTAPTLSAYTDIVFTSATTPRSTASVSWSAGDVIVVVSLDEGNNAATAGLGLPTATGLTFTNAQNTGVSTTACQARVDFAVAGSSGSSVITNTQSSGKHWGMGVWVFTATAGAGNSAKQSTTTHSVALTPTQVHSAMVWGIADFGAGALGTLTPTPSNTRRRAVDGTAYAYYVADLTDQISAGSTSYGLTETGGGPFSIVVFEIKGSAGGGGGSIFPPTQMMQGTGD